MTEKTYTEKVMEERGKMFEKWMQDGITAEKIMSWSKNPAQKAIINAMAMFAADEQVLTELCTVKPEKITVKEIAITRGEGPSSECGIPHTAKTWKEADQILHKMATSAPSTGGYDKIDFLVTMADDETYGGRFDLQSKHLTQVNLINRQMKETIEFHGGMCDPLPSHIKPEWYKAHILSDTKAVEECKEALKTWDFGY